MMQKGNRHSLLRREPNLSDIWAPSKCHTVLAAEHVSRWQHADPNKPDVISWMVMMPFGGGFPAKHTRYLVR